MRKKRHMIFLFVIIVIIFAIFFLTCILKPENILKMPKGYPWDKFVHISMFFVLSFAVLFSYHVISKGKMTLSKVIVYALIIPIIYGGIIELLQKFVFTYRSAEWLDFFADALGSILAFLLFFCVTWFKKLNKRKK